MNEQSVKEERIHEIQVRIAKKLLNNIEKAKPCDLPQEIMNYKMFLEGCAEFAIHTA